LPWPAPYRAPLLYLQLLVAREECTRAGPAAVEQVLEAVVSVARQQLLEDNDVNVVSGMRQSCASLVLAAWCPQTLVSILMRRPCPQPLGVACMLHHVITNMTKIDSINLYHCATWSACSRPRVQHWL
jgi:hypothetical protein